MSAERPKLEVALKSVSLNETSGKPYDSFIVGRVTEADLDNEFRIGIDEGFIGPEQWYRDYGAWYRVHNFNNPSRTIYQERFAIDRDSIQDLTAKTTRVIWGVGQGDTEIIPQIRDVESTGYSEAIAVDAVRDFLEGYVQGFMNLSTEAKEPLKFVAYHSLFDQVWKDKIEIPGRRYEKATHYVLSETVGNVRYQSEFFSRMSNHILNEGDFLVLGVGLLTDPDEILERYKRSTLFQAHIMSSLRKSKEGRKLLRNVKELDWRFDHDEGTVEANVGNLIVFRQKKYDLSELKEYSGKFDFEQRLVEVEDESAIVVLQKAA